jgi:hypothetical protein
MEPQSNRVGRVVDRREANIHLHLEKKAEEPRWD